MVFEKHVKVRHEKFGAVVFETLREKVFVTNETGAEILQLFEDGKEQAEIISELASRHDSSPEEVKTDVEEFVQQLKDGGIINKGEQ